MTLSAGAYLPTMDDQSELSVSRLRATATFAENEGYGSLWAGDHSDWRCGVLEPFAALAAVSGITSTVRLGTAVLLASLRHPVHTAKAVATLDHLCSGRFNLGVGLGTPSHNDFPAVGLPRMPSGAVLDAVCATVLDLLRGDTVSRVAGPYELQGAVVCPTPLQETVPLYFGGKSDHALGRVATSGAGWIAAFVSPERFAERVRLLHELWRWQERTGRPEAIMLILAQVGRDEEQAFQAAGAFLRRAYDTTPDRVGRMSAFGSPAGIRQQLERYVAAGATGFIVAPCSADERDTLSAALDAIASIEHLSEAPQ